jgi:ferredoxin, 2Fe-2S
MPNLNIPQKNLNIPVENGKNLMDALLEAGLPVASSCHGEGICSKCAVLMTPQGTPAPLEIQTATRNKVPESMRLCCQVFVDQDLTVATTYW